jgi:hypothetical protein
VDGEEACLSRSPATVPVDDVGDCSYSPVRNHESLWPRCFSGCLHTSILQVLVLPSHHGSPDFELGACSLIVTRDLHYPLAGHFLSRMKFGSFLVKS